MPECMICGLDDFEERDGMFFCTTCQTQTQELIVEDDELQVEGDGPGLRVDHRLQIGQRKESSHRTTVYKGRPWTIYEAYQIILKHQVQALIRLGTHPGLDEFVFRLWAVYLSKLEIAFCEDEKLYPQTLKKHVRHRDKYLGDVKNPNPTAVRNVRVHRERNLNKVTDTVSPDVLESEEFYEGDVPCQDDDRDDEFLPSDDDSDDGSSKEASDGDDDVSLYDESKNEEPKTTTNRLMAMRLEWCSLPKLLALCYLGLQYTNSLTTAAEVVRWVEQGEIPYTEVTSLLHEEFQFGSYDPQLFWAEIPKPHALRHLTGNLAYFLDITRLPSVSVSQLVSRYVVMLHLPAELHGLVMSVMSRCTPQCQFVIKSSGAPASLPFFDALAMTYIIFTLKLWFGLDDHTEKKLSDYTRDVMQLIDGKHDLFVFDEWKEHVINTVAQESEKPSLFSNIEATDIKDIDSLLESYYKSNQHCRRAPQCYLKHRTTRGDDYNRYKQSTKEDLSQPFKIAAEKMTVESEIGNDPLDYHSEDELEGHGQDEGQRFIGVSMKHITNPDTFLDDLERHGLSEETIYSSCVESENDEEEGSTNSDSEAASVDLFSVPRPKKKTKSAAKEAVRQLMTRATTPNRLQERHDFHGRMTEVRKKHVFACKDFAIYKRVLIQDQTTFDVHRHKTYIWLVNLCSKIIRCTPYELDVFVLQISCRYSHMNPKKVNLNRAVLGKFNKKYFAMDQKLDEDIDFIV